MEIKLPLELVIPGKPISHQTQNKNNLGKWKEHVYAVSKAAISGAKPVGCHIQITITHFYLADLWESGVPDSDNIVKPIRDALNKLIYADDYQITDNFSRRRNLNGDFRVRGMSPILAIAFSTGDEFVHLLIEEAPDQAKL